MYPIVANQRKIDIAEQKNGMTCLQRIRPNLTLNCPRGGGGGRGTNCSILNVPWYIMRPPTMIHAILCRALPHRAPRHRAPPQLCQAQVKLSRMTIHVTFYPCAAVGTSSRPGIAEPFLGLRAHHFQVLLLPHHMTEDRRWPLLEKKGQFVQRHRRFRKITHVHDSNAMKTLFQPPRIRNQNTHTSHISSLQNSTYCSTRPLTSQAKNVRDRSQVHHTFRMEASGES